jgi:hypothetical protein
MFDFVRESPLPRRRLWRRPARAQSPCGDVTQLGIVGHSGFGTALVWARGLEEDFASQAAKLVMDLLFLVSRPDKKTEKRSVQYNKVSMNWHRIMAYLRSS